MFYLTDNCVILLLLCNTTISKVYYIQCISIVTHSIYTLYIGGVLHLPGFCSTGITAHVFHPHTTLKKSILNRSMLRQTPAKSRVSQKITPKNCRKSLLRREKANKLNASPEFSFNHRENRQNNDRNKHREFRAYPVNTKGFHARQPLSRHREYVEQPTHYH